MKYYSVDQLNYIKSKSEYEILLTYYHLYMVIDQPPFATTPPLGLHEGRMRNLKALSISLDSMNQLPYKKSAG